MVDPADSLFTRTPTPIGPPAPDSASTETSVSAETSLSMLILVAALRTDPVLVLSISMLELLSISVTRIEIAPNLAPADSPALVAVDALPSNVVATLDVREISPVNEVRSEFSMDISESLSTTPTMSEKGILRTLSAPSDSSSSVSDVILSALLATIAELFEIVMEESRSTTAISTGSTKSSLIKSAVWAAKY